MRSFIIGSILLIYAFVPLDTNAHPMPNTVVLLDIGSQKVGMELQLPLGELQLAFGHDAAADPSTLVQRLGPVLKDYILAHIHPFSPDGRQWTVIYRDARVQPAEQSATGLYQELTADLWLVPPPGETTRAFTLGYDVIIHQLVTHKALVAIRKDWEKGIQDGHRTEAGIIRLDPRSNTIPPLTIDQRDGSCWTGFKSMIALGMQHIAEGTDHLLFLLVLLLPARRRILAIVTAFTIGHSITLLAGALGWLHLPGQPVEIAITISIIVSAIHAIHPLFPGKEAWVAAGFGLVHGLAFAGTLANLDLDGGRMALSILGFNIGIECMQLIVIAITVPWLILLGRHRIYPFVRMGGAALALIAAIGWMVERITLLSNPITTAIARTMPYAPWLIAALALTAILTTAFGKPVAIPPPQSRDTTPAIPPNQSKFVSTIKH